jgi:hypothetical protein
MDSYPLIAITLTYARPWGYQDLLNGAGGVAAVVAVGFAWLQVRRDRERARRQAVARARTAKMLIGAAYATTAVGVRGLIKLLTGGATTVDRAIMNQAVALRDNQQLAAIFLALITIDAATLSDEAQRPVEDAQRALIGMLNVVAGLAVHTRNPGASQRLQDQLRAILAAHDRLRGEVPFDLDAS